MLLRRSMIKMLIGLVLLANATNLFVFSAGGLTPASPALIDDGSRVQADSVADPLPHALVLTAIVIGFGVLAFAVALVSRLNSVIGSDDVEQVTEAEG